MIRVEVDDAGVPSWAHELTASHHVTGLLKQHGVPLTGRLVFSGVKDGWLETVHHDQKHTFTYREGGEHPDSAKVFERTHVGKGYKVFMSGRHLTNHKDEDL